MASRTVSCPPSIPRKKKKKEQQSVFSSPHAATNFWPYARRVMGVIHRWKLFNFLGYLMVIKWRSIVATSLKRMIEIRGVKTLISYFCDLLLSVFFSLPPLPVTKCIEICFIFTRSIFIDERWYRRIQRNNFLCF